MILRITCPNCHKQITISVGQIEEGGSGDFRYLECPICSKTYKLIREIKVKAKKTTGKF